MKANEIWFDADGVLLDYTDPFLKFIGSDLNYSTLLDYDLTKLFDTPEKCRLAMLRFTETPVFEQLPRICHPLFLASLKNVGYDLKVITKLPASKKAKVRRIENLSWHFGPVFSEVVFTGEGECKLDYLEHRYEHFLSDRDMVLIEDNPDLLIKHELKLEAPYGRNRYPIEVLAIRHTYNRTVCNRLKHTRVYGSTPVAVEALLERAV